MKRKKAALYDPFLDTMGGGEKHILSILQILSSNDYDIDIFWHEDLSAEIESKLHITFEHKPQFLNTWATSGILQRFQMLGAYDIFLYVTDGSYFFSSAKKNYVFCMVPQKSLYTMSSLNLLKTWNYQFIANSQYTKERLEGWEIFSDIIYPYIDSSFLDMPPVTKKPIILSVGRFFPHLHTKRQDIAIEWFKVLKEEYSEFKDYSLVLAGGVMPEDQDYLQMLKGLASNRDDIIFQTNIPFEKLKNLYSDSSFYWHFTGWEVDEKTHPEAVEHLGITPLEAMSSGCITCAYDVGGPSEIIKHKETGILFKNQQDLFADMKNILIDNKRQSQLRTSAKEYVQKKFSYEVFKRRVEEIISVT
ncbi:glycosyltransferase [Candidatus Woesebacteria bacterium]|nr:glycosyltransferase [Candidatus Woesebacteria bacterium]